MYVNMMDNTFKIKRLKNVDGIVVFHLIINTSSSMTN